MGIVRHAASQLWDDEAISWPMTLYEKDHSCSSQG